MKYLNLSDGLVFGLPGQHIAFERFVFPGGEPHIKLKSHFATAQDVTISTRVNNSDDFITLLLATDALYQSG